MKNIIRITLLPLLLVVASAAYGAVPSMHVTVSDPSGKVAFKGATKPDGSFATGSLQPGNYVVQFNSSNPGVKGNQFALLISAGKQKVMAEAVPGSKFAAGGVAMKVNVGKNMNITGLVTTGKAGGASVVAAGNNSRVKIINGKRYVWVEPETGSNVGGRWVEEGTPGASNVHRIGAEGVQNLQDRGSQGAVPGN